MAILGNVSSFNINGNELTLQDATLTSIVEEIVTAIGENNGAIGTRINDLNTRVQTIEGTSYENVQPDWNESNTNSDAYILHKPQVPTGTILYSAATEGLLASSSYNHTFTEALTGYDYVLCYFRPSIHNLSDTNAIPPAICTINLSADSALQSGEYIGTTTVQYINNENRYAAYSCIISADKTQFRIKYQQSLYGTASTDISNASHGIYCYKIVGYTKRELSNNQSSGSSSETPLSLGTPIGDGNAVTGINVQNHQITLVKGSTFLTEAPVTSVNGATGAVSINALPTVTSSDNGKILMVVNGAWTLVSPSTLYSGSGNPNNNQGNNGDLYIQV